MVTGAGDAAVLIPVKAFHEAKVRLAPALAPADRALLARDMATTVVRAARGLPVAVVCDDADVAEWAEQVGAEVLLRPGLGLDGAVADGVATLAARGTARVVVAHADLPHATDLRPWAGPAGTRGGGVPGDRPPWEPGTVALVPDRRRDGTNVISLPAACGFRFAYGPGSFARHRAEAERLGLPVVVAEDRELAWDVDVPADLARPSWAAT